MFPLYTILIIHKVNNFTRFQLFLGSVNIIVEDLNRSDTSSDESSDEFSDYGEWHVNSYGSPEHPEVTEQFDEK